MGKHIKTPLTEELIKSLKSGELLYITGVIYTARDMAHKRMYDTILKGASLPFDLKNNIIYYMGPSPKRKSKVIGSAGPTTSSRMDEFTPKMLEFGLKGMIGKGKRDKGTIDSMIENKAIYFAAIGGAGALLSKKIIKSEIIAYEDLGTEAIRKLYVEEFPVYVAIDCYGNNIYNY